MQLNEYASMRLLEDSYWWYAGLRSLTARAVLRALQGRSGSRALDAGCGTGGNMAFLRGRWPGIELQGIDIHSAALQATQARQVGSVCGGSVEGLPFPGDSFDLVFCLDVLYTRGIAEKRAIAEIFRVLKPGGKIILNLPAWEFLRGEHDRAVHTGRRYTKSRIRRLLAAAGFAVERITCWNAALFPALFLWRRLSRLRANRSAPRSDLMPLPALVNKILKGMILFEVRIAFHLSLPLGSSIFAIGRKEGQDAAG